MQKHSFDNLCLHQNCVNNNRAFYNYWDSFSQHENHNTMMIHPQAITQAFRLTQNARKQQKLEENLQKRIRDSIKQMLINLEQYIYKVLFEEDLKKYNQNATIYNKSDIKMLFQMLQKGDTHLLKAYLHFNKSTEKDIYSFIQKQSNEIKNQLQSTLQRTRNIIETSVKKNLIQRGLIKKDKQSFKSDLSILNNVQVSREAFNVSSSIIEQEEIIEQQSIDDSVQQIQQVQSEPREQYEQNENQLTAFFRKKNKRKMIKKMKEKEQKQNKEENILKTEIIGNISVILQQKYLQLLVQNLKNKQYNQNASEVHIFNEQLTNVKALQAIMEYFKNLRYISFNCSFLFINQQLSSSFIQRFARLSVSWKWNFQLFFKQYYSQIFFSGINPQRRQTIVSQRCLNLSKIIDRMQDSKSLWIYYRSMINPLNKQKNIYKGISQLSIICQLCTKKLNLFSDLKDLVVVVLKGINFTFQKHAQNKQIAYLIKNNPKIQTFILQQVKLTIYILKRIMQELATLPYLKRLSLASLYMVQIDTNVLCKCKNLVSIVLNNLTFKKYDPVQSIQLHQLQFLALNECYNTASAFLGPLLNHNKSTIKSLFFKQCPQLTVDNLDILKPLQKLEELGFFRVKITGKKLTQILREMKSYSFLDLPLKYLGVDKQYKTSEYPVFTLTDMQELVAIVPNLKRLSIGKVVLKQITKFKLEDLTQLIYLQEEDGSLTVEKVRKNY